MKDQIPTEGRPPVGIVIVHRDQGRRCVDTLRRFCEQDVPVDLIVADNDSRADELARIRDADLGTGQMVTVLQTGKNSGFGPGLNVGLRHWLRHGTGEWVIASPHDALLEPGGLPRLIALAESRERAGVLCADVGDQATPTIDPVLGAIPGPANVREGWEDADYPHGTLMLFRRSCLIDIGLFDERYFAYNDEADIGIRARAAGWECGLARGVMVENPFTSTGPPVIDYLRLRNTLLMQYTHFGKGKAAMRAMLALVNVAHATVRPSIRPPWYTGPARLYGVLDAFRRRWGPPPDSLLPDP